MYLKNYSYRQFQTYRYCLALPALVAALQWILITEPYAYPFKFIRNDNERAYESATHKQTQKSCSSISSRKKERELESLQN